MATDNNSSVLRAIFSRTFAAISLINMLGMVGYYAIFVICTHFAAEQFGASLAMAGLATGIVVIGCLVGRFFYGLHHSHCRLSTSALYRCCGHVFNERSLLDCRRSLATLYCSFHLRCGHGGDRYGHGDFCGNDRTSAFARPRYCLLLHEYGAGALLWTFYRDCSVGDDRLHGYFHR
jgi:hypothetical protein